MTGESDDSDPAGQAQRASVFNWTEHMPPGFTWGQGEIACSSCGRRWSSRRMLASPHENLDYLADHALLHRTPGAHVRKNAAALRLAHQVEDEPGF